MALNYTKKLLKNNSFPRDIAIMHISHYLRPAYVSPVYIQSKNDFATI